MKTPALILTVLAATLQMVPASARAVENLSRQEQIDESAKKVKELQKERIAALEEMAVQLTNLFQNGRVEFDEVIDAQLLLLEAKLEVAEKESDRITLYKNMVDVLKQYEALAGGRAKNAQGTHAAALKIKARRLEAEIRLEQAKAKEANDR
jgi:uncharacterized protein YlaN (UPF0358 family)